MEGWLWLLVFVIGRLAWKAGFGFWYLEARLIDGRLALAFGICYWRAGFGFWYLLLEAWLWLLLFGCCFGGLVD